MSFIDFGTYLRLRDEFIIESKGLTTQGTCLSSFLGTGSRMYVDDLDELISVTNTFVWIGLKDSNWVFGLAGHTSCCNNRSRG